MICTSESLSTPTRVDIFEGRWVRTSSISSQTSHDAAPGAQFDDSHSRSGEFYCGSYPPNCWRGIFTLVPNTKRDTELVKRALLAEKREKHLGR